MTPPPPPSPRPATACSRCEPGAAAEPLAGNAALTVVVRGRGPAIALGQARPHDWASRSSRADGRELLLPCSV